MNQLNEGDIEEYLENSNIDGNLLYNTNVYDLTMETPLYLKFIINLFREKNNFDEMNRFELYKKFLEKNIGRYYEKKKDVYDPNIKSLNEDVLRIHRVMALIVIFGEDMMTKSKIIGNFENLKQEFIDLKLKLGIIKSFRGTVPVFMHKTIAEYLAVECLS